MRGQRSPPAKSSRVPRAGEVREKQKVVKSTVSKSGHITVNASIGKGPYSSRDVSLFVSATMSFVPVDFLSYDQEREEEFGVLYRIGWAIQDHHRRFRTEENPLYVWHAIAILNDPKSRDAIGRNGERIAVLRRAMDSGVPDTWPVQTLRELEIREWIGDPTPAWVADYLSTSATRIIDPKPGRTVAQKLGLSERGGGASAHSRIQESGDRKRRHALRLIQAAKELKEKLSNEELADIFSVSIDTVKSWKRGAKANP